MSGLLISPEIWLWQGDAAWHLGDGHCRPKDRCQEKDLSKEWDVIIQNCQEKEVSRERDAKRKGCQGKIGFKRNWCQEKVVSEQVVMPMGLWAYGLARALLILFCGILGFQNATLGQASRLHTSQCLTHWCCAGALGRAAYAWWFVIQH